MTKNSLKRENHERQDCVKVLHMVLQRTHFYRGVHFRTIDIRNVQHVTLTCQSTDGPVK